ncbi:MAG: 3-methyl-2-oxobutanoate dehydrogenase subunit VorB [Planctomycetota bacterium]
MPRELWMGNEAFAEAALRAGMDCYFAYPITPQSEAPAYLARHMADRGRVFLQAESEVAAINMVYGAAAAGKRAMTSSSSPGISLMQEGISYLAGAELPAVIINIMRAGPGLGGITPSQADYFQAVKGGGHGDYNCIVLAPTSVQELADFTGEAFDLADRYRNPVIVAGDGILGQMLEPIEMRARYAEKQYDKSDWALTGRKDRPRHLIRSLFLSDVLIEHNHRLQTKFARIRREIVKYKEYHTADCTILVAAFGIMARCALAAVRQCRAEGIRAGLFVPQILWPYPSASLAAAAAAARQVLVAEMNAGQMVEDVRLAIGRPVPLETYNKIGGEMPRAAEVADQIRRMARDGR